MHNAPGKAARWQLGNLWQLRLPRVASAFACGGLLALAGALMQALLRNPLADPYVLGISGGVGRGRAGGDAAGLAAVAVNLAPSAARWRRCWAGARPGLRPRRGTQTRLLLTGVILAAGFGALISLMLTLAPAERLRGMLFWLMGDFSHARQPGLAMGRAAGRRWRCCLLARRCSTCWPGELKARSLGVAVRPCRAGSSSLAWATTAAVVGRPAASASSA